MSEKLKQVGRRIQEARKAAGLNQADLAEKVDISANHMSAIETGKTNCTIEVFMKLTEALNISADSLLRTNVPQVSAIYSRDMDALLKDCTAAEIESIMAMMRQMKAALISARPTEY